MYIGMEVLVSDAYAKQRNYTRVVGEKGKVKQLSGSWLTAYQVAIPSSWGGDVVWEIDENDCLPFAPINNEQALHLLKKQNN